MLDEVKNQIVVSQFGLLKRRGEFSINPFPAQSTITTLPLDRLRGLKDAGKLSGSLDNNNDLFISKKEMQWPNILNRLPAEYGDYIVIADGFLPPGKSDGNIFLANSTGGLFRITPEEKGACYHETDFHDFNGDGLEDILTARFVKSGPFFAPKFNGDLLWYENPGVSQITSEWKQHIITQGPDVIFKKIPYEKGFAIFTTEFFDQRLTVQFVSAQGVLIDSRVIDDSVGKPFAVSYEDLDGDGTAELLVTNHQDETKDDIGKGIFAYEVPSDLRTGKFLRHTLAQDVSDLKAPGGGAGSPGIAEAFYPRVGMTGPKHIIAAGDGSFDVWYLVPKAGRFQYDVSIIEFEGTTGQMLLNDFDNDGVMDVLVPDNDQWKLQLITFEQS